MAVSDWISRLFTSGNAQGLSGESAGLEPDAAWFDGRLQRHCADGDLIADPTLIWQPASGSGLASHLRSRTRDTTADFTDVLIVINSADWSRSLTHLQEPWTDTAARALDKQLDQLSTDEAFPLLFAARGLCFHLIADGGPEMAGESYGLEPGEFVTGLLPNHYTGPSETSRPVVAVHLNLPDVWEGYKEVGRLYSDQVSFTLGTHWLDNFSHFAFKEPGLYRLQQYLDGSFVHIIDPDLQARYSVVSDQEAGANVLTLMDMNGEVIAHLILALLDSVVSEEPSAPSSATSLPGIAMPTPVLAEPMPSFTGLDSLESMGHKTIVPESIQQRIFTLRESGALLQKVHFHNFMQGYDVYVSGNGALTTRTLDRAATFQVRANQVSLVVHKPQVRVDGTTIALETPQPILGDLSLQVGPHVLQYRDLSSTQTPGWPYLGEILRPATRTHMIFGGTYGIGRDRQNKVQLPDEPHNDNIAWLDNSSSGVIRSRSGEINKNQFYTDSIMVASKHAEIDLANEPELTSIAKHCYTYVRRQGQVHPLVPTKQDGNRTLLLQSGDEILVGNCLFSVSYGSKGENTPKKTFTAASLAKAADGDSWADSTKEDTLDRERRRADRSSKPPASLIDEILNARSGAGDTPNLESPSRPPSSAPKPSLDPLLNPSQAPKTTDLPAAAGLGEEGLPPEMPRITSHGYDSLMGLDPNSPSVLQVDEEETPQRPDPLAGTKRDDSAVFNPHDVQDFIAEQVGVAIVDEDEIQHQLASPARLVHIGWALSGEVTIGNHHGCDVVVPENQVQAGQLFEEQTYCSLRVRGQRGNIELLSADQARLSRHGESISKAKGLDEVLIEIIRRDEDGDEDFAVQLELEPKTEVPDPRGRLLAIDLSNRIVASLFTQGLPLGTKHRMRLGPIVATLHFDGVGAKIMNYLESYQLDSGLFAPFFQRKPGQSFQTLPQDGRPIQIQPGDELMAGVGVYRFELR